MPRHRIVAFIALCCFAVASALPSFAAVLPANDGTVSIVICSADGFKTIEIEESGNGSADETRHLCDVCQIHCGMGTAAQLIGWAFPTGQAPEKTARLTDLQIPLLVAVDPKLPRGPPHNAARLLSRA